MGRGEEEEEEVGIVTGGMGVASTCAGIGMGGVAGGGVTVDVFGVEVGVVFKGSLVETRVLGEETTGGSSQPTI